MVGGEVMLRVVRAVVWFGFGVVLGVAVFGVVGLVMGV